MESETENQMESETENQMESETENQIESETENQNEKFMLKSNPSWADAIAKILRSKKITGKKSIVLSKAKKLSDVKQKEKTKSDFEIVNAVEEHIPYADETEDKESVLRKKFKSRDYQSRGRVKPSILEKDREKMLLKISTKGVVQLFNQGVHLLKTNAKR